MIFAIPAAEPAIPPNPNTAATSAITKNITAQRNITIPFNNEWTLTNASNVPTDAIS